MKDSTEKKHPLLREEADGRKIILPGYPNYPENEDIYKQCKKEKDIDPEDISVVKKREIVGEYNAKDFEDDMTGSDLDVPDSEIDEAGDEDEENKYYSLGGEDHENLEEHLD